MKEYTHEHMTLAGLCGVIVGLLLFAIPLIITSNNSERYKNLLIEFKHARWIINPVTGASEFQIDTPLK